MTSAHSGNRGLSPYLSKRRRLREFVIVRGPKLLKITSFMDGPYINTGIGKSTNPRF